MNATDYSLARSHEPHDGYYSKAQLARKWAVHPNTIQRIVAARQIRFIRVRGQLRFRPQDIDEYEARFGVAPVWGEDAA